MLIKKNIIMKHWKLKIILNIILKFIGCKGRFIFYYDGNNPSDYKDKFIDYTLIRVKFNKNGNLIHNQEVILFL